MSDINARTVITLETNGKQAEEQLTRLKKRAENLRDAVSEAAKAGDKVSLEKYSKELKKVEKDIRSVQSATQNVEDVMKRLDSATPNELRKSLKVLEGQLKNIERGSSAWDEQTAKIRKVREELDSVNKELRNQETFFGRVKRTALSWKTAIIAGIGSFTGLSIGGKAAVEDYAEMEQEMANVSKFTGMAAKDVKVLNEELKKMDTRTSREELNQLAQEAGRLGKKSVEDVLGFVRAADKINVSLDDLGDGATLTLSKLTQIFGDEERLGTERALLSVGSVINELSQNCAASAPYITDFTSRLGGIGSQAGMTVQQIMGLASVMSARGQQLEVSATSISQLITKMYQDSSKYAKAAGLDVEEFSRLVKTDANEALLTLAEALHAKGGLSETAPIFAEMKENGAGVIQTLATLAENVSFVREQQEAANKAFSEGTSISEEFAVQNGTVQASLDKAKKSFHEVSVEIGEKLYPLMDTAITTATTAARGVMEFIRLCIEHRVQILEICTAIAAYNVLVNIATIRTKALTVVTATQKGLTYAWMVAQQAWNVVTALCTANVRRLTQEVKLLSAMLKISPWGIAIAAITAAVVALTSYWNKTKDVIASEKTLNSIREEAASKVSEEISSINLLLDAARNETLSLEERKKAIDKLNEIIPEYNGYLDETTGKYNENTAAVDAYIKALIRKAEIEGAKEQISQLSSEKASLAIQKSQKQREKDSAQKELNELSDKYVENASRIEDPELMMTGRALESADITRAKRRLDKIEGEIGDIEKRKDEIDQTLDTIKDLYGEDIQKSVVNASESNNTGGSGSGDGDGNPDAGKDKFKAEKEWKARQEALNRIAYATGKLIDEEGRENVYTYEDYVNKALEIEKEFLEKKKSHRDLTKTEELEIEAEYQETLLKIQKQTLTNSIEEEQSRHKEAVAELQQLFVDGRVSYQAYTRQMEEYEMIHLQQMVLLTKEGSQERESAEDAYRDKNLQNALKRQKETEAAEREHQKALSKIKTDVFGNNQSENDEEYKKSLELLDEVYALELDAARDNVEEKLRIEEAYQKAKLALMVRYNQVGEQQNLNSLQSLGIKISDWLNSDGGKAVTGTMDFLTSQMSGMFSSLTSLVQSGLEIQTAAIEKRYDTEIAKAQGNSYMVAQLEKKKEKEIAKAKNDANKKMFAMQVIQAVAQTAQNALAAYGSAAAIPLVGYILAPIAASMAVAAGIIQVAAIKKQQQASMAQGYSEGGFTRKGDKNEPVGIVHAGEWVASQKLVNNSETRPMIDALEYAQRNNTIGSFRRSDITAVASRTISLGENEATASAIKVSAGASMAMTEAISKLTDRLEEPFVTVNTVSGEFGIKQAQDKYDLLIRNKTPKSRR